LIGSAAITSPEVKVTLGNALLIRAPTISYMTGDAIAGSLILLDRFEIDMSGAGIVSVPAVSLRLHEPGSSPSFLVHAVIALPHDGRLKPLLGNTTYRVRSVFRKAPGMTSSYSFPHPSEVVMSTGWSDAVLTLPPR
jgi:hypothetical protein